MIVVGREVGGEIAARTGQRAELLQNRGVRLVAPAKPFAQPLLLLGWQFFNRRFNFRNRAHARQRSKSNGNPQAVPMRMVWGEAEMKTRVNNLPTTASTDSEAASPHARPTRRDPGHCLLRLLYHGSHPGTIERE